MAATRSSGVSNDSAKKRKDNPTTSEIFTTPVPETGDTTANGGNVQSAPKKAYVAPPKSVR